jgi:hypothetical protein
MLYREIIAVCSQIHTKHINTVCGLSVELLNVKLAVNIVTTGGTYSDHWTLKACSSYRALIFKSEERSKAVYPHS